MFRFQLRTLLIATALIGLTLAFQVHVHNKAKRFVEEMRKEKSVEFQVEQSSVLPPSVIDLICFQRRCETKASSTVTITSTAETKYTEAKYVQFTQVDRVKFIGGPESISRKEGMSFMQRIY